jgi:hypothetical protein
MGQFENGVKQKDEAYTLVDPHLFPDKNLRINNCNGGLTALLVPTMPDELRKPVLAVVRRLFSPHVKSTDSSLEGENGFLTYHFSVYNRFSQQVSIFFILFSPS